VIDADFKGAAAANTGKALCQTGGDDRPSRSTLVVAITAVLA
jgi:hypothetical protein